MKFRTRDPLAIALGNASLFGVGYFMLGRRRFGVATIAISLALITCAVAIAQTWAEIVVLAWWAATITHGWFLADRDAKRPEPLPEPAPAPWSPPWGAALAPGTEPVQDSEPGPGLEPSLPVEPALPADAAQTPRPPAGRGEIRVPRWIAAGTAAVVLLAFGLLRFDAVRIGGDVAAARADGNCAGVFRAQDGVWLGDRVADAPLSASGDTVGRNCRRLQAAGASLDSALNSGDAEGLERPFGTFESVLNQPGNQQIVAPVLNRFLNGLPTKDPCDTVALTDWLRDHHPAKPPLNRSAEAVRRAAPAALLGCADDQMSYQNWSEAQARYQQFLDEYPYNAGAGKAKDGAELANVSSLLDGPADDKPGYCSNPAKYSNAPKYGKGVNKAMFFGNTKYTDKLPKSWKTSDPAKAALVVCADNDKNGPTVQTCTYQSEKTGKLHDVSFHQIGIRVKAYALRTGTRVADRTIEISGTSCPTEITHTYYGDVDLGPDPDQYVRDPDVAGAFHSLVVR